MPKTVFITGCSSGFGRASVIRFLGGGWNVVATMRDPAKWDGGQIGDRLMILPLDVPKAESIDAAFSAAIERFGKIDAVVNNAGKGLFSVFEVTPQETVQDVFETNFFGPLKVMRAAIPRMRLSGGGTVVNIASGSAIVAEPLMATYSASKAALDSFTEALTGELADQAIRLKIVIPGFVPGTNFLERTRAAAEAIPVPKAYEDYVNARLASYTSASPVAFATDEEVAEVIFSAAGDARDQLRWLVGPDMAEASHLWRETSEAEYAAWRRSHFGIARRPFRS
jgi:NAD(P)-dependent dehydrogenase (short-subunit alcohol dehydrogenase family)